jgi:hypothetical protein
VQVGGGKRKIGEKSAEKWNTTNHRTTPSIHVHSQRGSSNIDSPGTHARPPQTPKPKTTTPYPSRDLEATYFHKGSAGINPLGAHARPVKPLPKRRLPSTSPQITSSATRIDIESPSPLPYSSQTPRPHPFQVPHPHSSQPPQNPKPHQPPPPQHHISPPPLPPTASLLQRGAVRPNRIVSRSFGSFDGSGMGGGEV